MKNILLLKLKDGFISILPIYLIIIILNFTPLLNISSYEIGVLSFATILAGIGIALFNMGSDLAMTPMGKLSGANLTKQGKLITLLIFVFVLGFFVTLAEPNLSILGQQIANLLNPLIIIVAVAFGVGLALVLLVIRSIHKIDLSKILLFLYGLAFALTTLVIYTGSSDFLGFIFDAGGVTTGPVTVPFMMAICIGISSILAKKADKDMSFGLIGLVAIMSIIIMLFLGIFIEYNGDFTLDTSLYQIDTNFGHSLWNNFSSSLTSILLSVALIYIFFLIINFIFIKLPKNKLLMITFGVLYSLFGLTFFLTAVNMAYMPIAYTIGSSLTVNIPVLYIIGFVIGAVSVFAEPAVHVLIKQVNEITDGVIKKRIIYDFEIMFILVPALMLALGLAFFIPKIYVAVAFDSGGVAAGALTSGFVLPFALGICNGFSYSDALALKLGFGVVALVSITPVIVIELIGFESLVKDKIHMKRQVEKMIQKSDEVIIKF